MAPDSSPLQGNPTSDTSVPTEMLSPTEKKKPAPGSTFVIHFRGIMQGLTLQAVLLPSLEAQYKVGGTQAINMYSL